MKPNRSLRWVAGGIVVTVVGYAACAGLAFVRYGHIAPAVRADERDELLDRFMPRYEVVERHQVHVRAPVDLTFAAASDLDLEGSAVVRTIFKLRAWFMRGGPDSAREKNPQGFVARMQALGWGVLAEIPGREIVMGGGTRPWDPNPVFTALAPDAFIAFNEPDYVKIAFNLRVDPAGTSASVFRSETRAVATEVRARSKFRRYWSLVSPGVSLIRWLMLGPLKADAERRASGSLAQQGE
jgi:hypothetical protein